MSFALGSSFRSFARSASVTRPSRRARRPAAVQLPSRVLPVIYDRSRREAVCLYLSGPAIDLPKPSIDNPSTCHLLYTLYIFF